MEFKQYTNLMNSLFAVLGIILIALGVIVRGDNVYSGITYVLIGIVQLLIAGASFIRIRDKDGRELGNVSVQHSWWLLSVGIAALALFPSDFFSVSSTAIGYSAIAIAIIWVVLNAVSIYVAVKKTKARLVV